MHISIYAYMHQGVRIICIINLKTYKGTSPINLQIILSKEMVVAVIQLV